ncbi:LCP family protein [Sporosarcina sp. SAFN-015]|uniref:LCP family protein n=1 Tax=Sporosarcina sp. SAFN-015 TaxID=3387274 RepID=UPI003F803600
MKDKRLRDKLYNTSVQDLKFTKEDRNEVFEQIHRLEKNDAQKKFLVPSSLKLAPLTVSLLALGLCVFLFIPSNPSVNIANESNESTASNANANESVVQEDKIVTTLLTVKDDDNRIPINLLLTYSKDKKMMKVLSIPRDTYALISDNERTTPYDKLSHAYVNSSGGAEDVRTTVSTLFDLPIDYHAVIDLETLSSIVDSVNGIEFDIQEDIRVRALSTVAFEFEKGTRRLNGEEMAALLMDATVGSNLSEEDQLHLMNAFINQTINVLPPTQLKQLIRIEGNFPVEQLVDDKMELPSIQLVSLIDGMINTSIDEIYYIKYEKEFLNAVSEELTTFN